MGAPSTEKSAYRQIAYNSSGKATIAGKASVA